MSEDRAGTVEGPDTTTGAKFAGNDSNENPHKVEDAVKAGREDFDPNAESEGGEDGGSTEKGGDDSHLQNDQNRDR